MRFNASDFLTREGASLLEYCSDLLDEGVEVDFSSDEVDSLRDSMECMDASHLVFALEIGAKISPKTFIALAPYYLRHSELSVACAAARVLSQSRRELIGDATINEVRGLLTADSVNNRELIERLVSEWNLDKLT